MKIHKRNLLKSCAIQMRFEKGHRFLSIFFCSVSVLGLSSSGHVVENSHTYTTEDDECVTVLRETG